MNVLGEIDEYDLIAANRGRIQIMVQDQIKEFPLGDFQTLKFMLFILNDKFWSKEIWPFNDD